MNFRSDIEGLRAVAVLPVVAFHLSPSLMPGGFVGVDVFFVISGYLITGLLLHRLDSGNYSTIDFYVARIRRIFPALFAMLLVCSVIGAFALPPDEYAELGSTLLSTALFYSNYEFNRLSDYFGGAAELKPLLHTWSLSVEEQFYVVFPLLLVLLRRAGNRRLTLVLVGLACVSLLYSIRTTNLYPSLAFYSTLTRAFELLCGAIVASRRPLPLPGRLPQAAALAGLALIAISLLSYSRDTAFPGLHVVAPAGGTALVLLAGHGGGMTWVGSVLSWPVLRWFGRISYSLYLWHWPVIVFFKHFMLRAPRGWEVPACAALAVALALLSYRYIESVCRKPRPGTHGPLLVGGGLIATTCCVGLAISLTSGLPGRFDRTALAYFDGSKNSSPARAECHANADESLDYAQRCVFGRALVKPGEAVVVWGDSHATELAYAMGETGRFPVLQVSSSKCPPALKFEPAGRPRCSWRNEANLREVAADSRVGSVVLVAYFDTYLLQDRQAFEHGLALTADHLLKAGKRVIVMAPFPRFEMPVPASLGMLHSWGDDPSYHALSTTALAEQRQSALAAINGARRAADFELIDPAAVLCSATACPAADAQGPLYFDEHHISLHGARKLAAAVVKRLVSAAEQ